MPWRWLLLTSRFGKGRRFGPKSRFGPRAHFAWSKTTMAASGDIEQVLIGVIGGSGLYPEAYLTILVYILICSNFGLCWVIYYIIVLIVLLFCLPWFFTVNNFVLVLLFLISCWNLYHTNVIVLKYYQLCIINSSLIDLFVYLLWRTFVVYVWYLSSA